MFIMDDETGDAILRQGDSYSFKIIGVPDDWDLYYSVYRKEDRTIVFEIKTNPINSEATINVTAEDSDKLVVPQDKKYEIYCWGAKRCKDGVEDTLIIGNKQVGDLNKLQVYPKITEGEIPEDDQNGNS